MSGRLTVRAPAKVNLRLRVRGRRPDGYHDVETLFQSVDLCDSVTVELGGRGIGLVVEGADVGPEADNLAYRAAHRFLEAVGSDAGVRIALRKRIPAGAGLGGGSSDAAAVLRCLAALLGDPGRERLSALGATLGSDVPFFLGSSTLAEGLGRGEILRPLPPLPTALLVLVLPPVHVSTAWAYGALADARSDEGAPGASRSPEAAEPDGSGATDWSSVVKRARNDFEEVVAAAHPEIRRSVGALRDAGARLALMSGSGAASFGLFDDAAGAARAASRLTGALGWPCVAVRTLSEPPACIQDPPGEAADPFGKSSSAPGRP